MTPQPDWLKAEVQAHKRRRRVGNSPPSPKLPLGVHRNKGGDRYIAQITVGNRGVSRTVVHLGTFDTPAEASAAFQAAKQRKEGTP